MPCVRDKKQYQHEWYIANKDKVLAGNKRRQGVVRAKYRAAKRKPCKDCGERFPEYVMDFAHKDGQERRYSPARIVKTGSLRVLRAELAKCDVVCANCHRIRLHHVAE